jgi:hypothetical protein
MTEVYTFIGIVVSKCVQRVIEDALDCLYHRHAAGAEVLRIDFDAETDSIADKFEDGMFSEFEEQAVTLYVTGLEPPIRMACSGSIADSKEWGFLAFSITRSAANGIDYTPQAKRELKEVLMDSLRAIIWGAELDVETSARCFDDAMIDIQSSPLVDGIELISVPAP